MKKDDDLFNIARRRTLKMLGLGAAAAAVGAALGSDRLFAKQFVGEATRVKVPKMVYDPDLQMMVDPDTRVPIYEDMENITVASGLPTITSSSPENPCSDCPKKDDDGE